MNGVNEEETTGAGPQENLALIGGQDPEKRQRVKVSEERLPEEYPVGVSQGGGTRVPTGTVSRPCRSDCVTEPRSMPVEQSD